MSNINTGPDTVGTLSVATSINEEAPGLSSAVSWPAIFAGAAGAAALSLLLLILGAGLGFTAVSPWSMEGIGTTTLGFAAIAWLGFTQIAASGLGGYLAGRLRIKWTAVQTDEVYFRDTAHGFLTWAVASLLTAAVLTSVAGSIVGKVAGTAAGSAATLAAGGSGAKEIRHSIEYFVDSLFRGDSLVRDDSLLRDNSLLREEPAASAGGFPEDAPQPTREPAREVSEIPSGEVTRIFARALRTGTLPQEDERYIARLIAQRTDLSQGDAERRVSASFQQVQTTLQETETKAREVAEEARKVSAYGALWMAATLLLGAFTASLMAIFGGRQRDA